MIKKKGFPLRLVGRERQHPKSDSLLPDKESVNEKTPQPEVISDWEGEGGRLDPMKDTPGTDMPAKER